MTRNRLIEFVVALLFPSAFALASPILYEYVPSTSNPWVGTAVPNAGSPAPQFESTAWDGWRIPFVGGVTEYHGFAPWSGHEIAENMTLAPGTAGLLSDLGFTIVNHTSLAMGGILNLQYSCYLPTGELLFRRELDFDFSSFPIPRDSGALIRVGQGLLLQRGDVLPDECLFSYQLSNDSFPLMNDLEMFYGSPLNGGTSDRTYRDFTTGQTLELPENQNLAFYVKTFIPAPGVTAVLAAFLPFALRRRR